MAFDFGPDIVLFPVRLQPDRFVQFEMGIIFVGDNLGFHIYGCSYTLDFFDSGACNVSRVLLSLQFILT